MEFTAAQVLGWLTYLNRNLLHFWDHTRELIQPMVPVPKQNEERTQRRWRVYSEDQLRQLALLNRCYGMHLTPEFAAGVLSEPCRLRDTLAEPVLRPLLQLTEEMANAIHSGDHDQFWHRSRRGQRRLGGILCRLAIV